MITYFQNLSTKDAIISERLLHVIVTSSIDLAELEPSNYKKHIKTVKSGTYCNIILS